MDKNTNFIKTCDVITAERMKKSGYTLVCERNGYVYFLNDSKLVVSPEDKKYIVFTNILTFEE